MKRLTVLAVMAGILGCGAIPSRALPPTGNLLANPGAETQNLDPFWFLKSGSDAEIAPPFGQPPPAIFPHSGNFEFFGNTGPAGSITQTVQLGSLGLSQAQIDGGQANIDFFEQGLDSGPISDDAGVQLDYFDSADNLISSSSTGEIDNHAGVWGEVSQSFFIPAGTRSIDYNMFFVRHVGSGLDSYIDDNSLTITPANLPQGTPELDATSAGLVIALGAFGAMLAFDRRKRRTAPPDPCSRALHNAG